MKNLDLYETAWVAVFGSVGWAIGTTSDQAWYWAPAVAVGFFVGMVFWEVVERILRTAYRKVAS